ncbi:MAG: F0F1 ATP synthase subunit B family protein [Phenylobacterium sp.]
MELFQEAEFWVGVALVIFVGIIVYLKVPAAAMKALDARAEKIRGELAEAERLRQEAEELLASIRVRHQDAERKAVELLKSAEAEAKRLEEEAYVRLEDLFERRALIAERKIAQAAAQAAADVKSAAAEMAAETALAVLTRRSQTMTTDPLLDKGIAELAGKLQ